LNTKIILFVSNNSLALLMLRVSPLPQRFLNFDALFLSRPVECKSKLCIANQLKIFSWAATIW